MLFFNLNLLDKKTSQGDGAERVQPVCSFHHPDTDGVTKVERGSFSPSVFIRLYCYPIISWITQQFLVKFSETNRWVGVYNWLNFGVDPNQDRHPRLLYFSKHKVVVCRFWGKPWCDDRSCRKSWISMRLLSILRFDRRKRCNSVILQQIRHEEAGEGYSFRENFAFNIILVHFNKIFTLILVYLVI